MQRKRGLSLNHIAETLFCEQSVCKEGGVLIVRKQN